MLRPCRGDAGRCCGDAQDAGGCLGMQEDAQDAGACSGVQEDAGGMLGVQEGAGEMQGMLSTPAPCLPLAAGVNQQQCQLCRLFGIV